MAKAKFYYDTETLTYKPLQKNPKKIIRNTLLYLIAILLNALIGFFVLSMFINSPAEKIAYREIEYLKINYELLENRLNETGAILEEIERRDNNIYRVFFEAKPISKNQRTQGFSGINRYKSLKGFNTSEMVIEANKKMDILEKRLVIQSKSLDEIIKLAKNKKRMLSSIPAIQPVSNKSLRSMASGFGMRIHPIYKTRKMHWGMDFAAPKGTKVYATGDGYVKDASSALSGYGNCITINHGFGYETLYAHLSKYNVSRGQRIKRGDLIGFVGSTGQSTSPHLHYEVKKGASKLNPVYFYHNDLSPEEYEQMLKLSSQENQSLD